MEGVAWFTHRYIMHGLLWHFHRDHHTRDNSGVFEKNDFFFLHDLAVLLLAKSVGQVRKTTFESKKWNQFKK